MNPDQVEAIIEALEEDRHQCETCSKDATRTWHFPWDEFGVPFCDECYEAQERYWDSKLL